VTGEEKEMTKETELVFWQGVFVVATKPSKVQVAVETDADSVSTA